MSWYVIDAVDNAFERTKNCLFQPFDILKWIKLTIITLLIGAGGSFNGGNGSRYSSTQPDSSWVPQSFADMISTYYQHLTSFPDLILIIGALVLVILFIVILGIISSVMEFVFVESLVRNDVRILSYFKRYLKEGMYLFALRILIGLATLIFIGILILPFLLGAGVMGSGLNGPEGFFVPLFIIFGMMGFFTLLFLIILFSSIIGSFVNMAIPVSLYSDRNIFSALSGVLGQFRRDWQQIIIYWIGRLLLGIAVAIVVAIAAVIILLLFFALILIVDLILYFGLSAIFSDTTVWILLIPILLVEFILFILLIAFVGMPGKVFMKYHMLSFLQKWYPVQIPMFDTRQRPDSHMDEWVAESSIANE
ncbi:MAG: hypothetical protein QCH31_10845 [Methanolobus sp.]|nr:hypothetical protein [Methanolobus sp.]